jgi:hypothetical protein
MPTQQLTPEIINAAIDGFEAQKSRIDAQIAELRALLPSGRSTAPIAATSEPTTRKRRKMSAAARKRIGDAQRKRWATAKRPSESRSKAPAKAKRKMSAAGRKAISDATKKRWALKRAEAAKK